LWDFQAYLLPPAGRLAETTVSIGGDAGCEGFGSIVAEMRHTFPNRCCRRSTGARLVSVRAVASGSSTKIIFQA
jgi:hypothetical protein